jgi:hypothetical protein
MIRVYDNVAKFYAFSSILTHVNIPLRLWAPDSRLSTILLDIVLKLVFNQ